MLKQEIKTILLNNIHNFIGKQTKEVVPALFQIDKVGEEMENEAHYLFWNLPFLSYLGYQPITEINIRVIKQEIKSA